MKTDSVIKVLFSQNGILRFSVVMLFCAVLFGVAGNAYSFEKLPRIGTRQAIPYAEFFNTDTGEKFMPIGSSYVNLHWIGETGFHANFIPGLYDSQAADAALEKMAAGGYTVVRVWSYRGHSILRNAGFYSTEGDGTGTTSELYQPYIDNLIDFLERATNHKIYVQLAIDTVPDNTYYNSLYNQGFPEIEGTINREYLTSGAIAAKETYIAELLDCIVDYNPDLLSTIFGYEIRNEVNSRTDAGPFNRTSGWILTANGEFYDMGSAVSRQACQDENITHWLNRCAAAIKAKDPQALTTASVFTFLPVGKDGLAGAGLLPIETTDRRWPILPSVLINTNIDYLDVHEYLPHDWQASIASSNMGSLDWTAKPFVCGEFGAHRSHYGDVYGAAVALNQHRENIFNSGFQGAYLFTWDTYSHHRWTALEDGEIVNERLKPSSWRRWLFDIDGFTNFWTAGDGVSGLNASSGVVSFDITGSGASISSPTIRLDADKYKNLRIKLKNQSQGAKAAIYWITGDDRNWDAAKSVEFNISQNDNDYEVYFIDLSAKGNWEGLVSAIRFMPVEENISAGSYSIDYIEFTQDPPVCGDFGYLDTDFNNDCVVDIRDFAILAKSWL